MVGRSFCNKFTCKPYISSKFNIFRSCKPFIFLSSGKNLYIFCKNYYWIYAPNSFCFRNIWCRRSIFFSKEILNNSSEFTGNLYCFNFNLSHLLFTRITRLFPNFVDCAICSYDIFWFVKGLQQKKFVKIHFDKLNYDKYAPFRTIFVINKLPLRYAFVYKKWRKAFKVF